jgi:hypothetical protein
VRAGVAAMQEAASKPTAIRKCVLMPFLRVRASVRPEWARSFAR